MMLVVADDQAGVIIGRGGANIKQVQEECGIKVAVQPRDPHFEGKDRIVSMEVRCWPQRASRKDWATRLIFARRGRANREPHAWRCTTSSTCCSRKTYATARKVQRMRLVSPPPHSLPTGRAVAKVL